MFLRWIIERNRRDEVAELRAEVAALREEVAEIKRGGTYVNEDGEKVPMSQVISEYLYGAKEGDA